MKQNHILLNPKAILLALLCCASMQLAAQTETYKAVPKSYKYRVTFTDKKNCGFTVKKPEQFLSPKAVERRKKFGLKVDEYDLPITAQYVDFLTDKGFHVYNRSKWNNSVVVETVDTAKLAQVRAASFVKDVRCVWVSRDSVLVEPEVDRHAMMKEQPDTTLSDYYGYGAQQVRMLGADKLHEQGYKGQGVTIAVIDGGFNNADLLTGVDQSRILGTRNFVRPQKSVYEEQSHGMCVLTCIAANKPHLLVGTAPEASFYLLQSEDNDSEQLVEEDNWCAAVEYADSLGCDIVTSSLGYYRFEHKYMDHTYSDLDGRTAINSRIASLAASRGIVVLNSAGNSGMGAWKKIGFPADATDILTVGAVRADSVNTAFSSIGDSSDGRVKPDVMVMGENSAVFNTDGSIVWVDGTSFSCPTMCGAVACLMQAFPKASPKDIIRAVQQSGNNAEHPDNIFGYGIPNMPKAMQLLQERKK